MRKITTITVLAAFFLFFASWQVIAQQNASAIQELIDKKVQNEQGEEIGTITNVLTKPDGEIEAVLIKSGQILGLGGETERIPWSELRMGDDPDYLIHTPGQAADRQRQTSQQERDPQQQTSQEEMTSARTEQGQQAQQKERKQEEQSGQITVQQPSQQIEIDQPQPQVQVEQQKPTARVQQAPPEVIVKQPAPEIEVQVEQPKPQVQVQQAQPDVQVEQAKPQVDVMQPEPQVNVEQQKPQVDVSKAKPEVQVTPSDEAEVYIEDQEQPRVSVEQEKPEVSVSEVEPQDSQKQGRGSHEKKMDRAEEWKGREIMGTDGEQLGRVENVFLSEDGNQLLYVMVQDEKQKLHPMPAGMLKEAGEKDQLRAQIDKNTFDQSPSYSRDELAQMEEQQMLQEVRAYYGDQVQPEAKEQKTK
jgi:sporulation protein YlmC with PRC-barrel domain